MFFAQNFIKLSTHTCILLCSGPKKLMLVGQRQAQWSYQEMLYSVYISFIPDQWPVPSVENHHLIEPEELVQSLSFALYWFPRL